MSPTRKFRGIESLPTPKPDQLRAALVMAGGTIVGNPALMRATGMAKQTLKTHVARARAEGWLTPDEGRGPGRPTTYSLVLESRGPSTEIIEESGSIGSSAATGSTSIRPPTPLVIRSKSLKRDPDPVDDSQRDLLPDADLLALMVYKNPRYEFTKGLARWQGAFTVKQRNKMIEWLLMGPPGDSPASCTASLDHLVRDHRKGTYVRIEDYYDGRPGLTQEELDLKIAERERIAAEREANPWYDIEREMDDA